MCECAYTRPYPSCIVALANEKVASFAIPERGSALSGNTETPRSDRKSVSAGSRRATAVSRKDRIAAIIRSAILRNYSEGMFRECSARARARGIISLAKDTQKEPSDKSIDQSRFRRHETGGLQFSFHSPERARSVLTRGMGIWWRDRIAVARRRGFARCETRTFALKTRYRG